MEECNATRSRVFKKAICLKNQKEAREIAMDKAVAKYRIIEEVLNIEDNVLNVSESLEIDFVLETVKSAIEKHGLSFNTETLIHSDRGCHYTSKKFIQILNDFNLRRSMSRRGNCWDNAPQESFFGHMKQETHFERCKTVDELKAAIDDWMDYYNNDRYQEGLAKLSPNEYYNYITTGIYPLNI